MAGDVPSALGSGEVDGLADLLRAGGGTHGVRGVLLTGAPGAGKSTTLEALGCRMLVDGFDTRRVMADDVGRERPFGVITDLLGLDRVYPPRPDTADHLMAAMESLCGAQPVALCVDDAHRADPDSLDVLGRVHRLATDLPVVLVLTRRAEPERTGLVAIASHPDVATIEVTGWDAGAVGEVVRSRYGAPPSPRLGSLLATGGGNPLRVVTLLGELDRHRAISIDGGDVDVDDRDHAVSASVEGGIRSQLGLVDLQARELLQLLAVWGGTADPVTLAEVAGGTPTAVLVAVRLAVAAGILRWSDDERVTFSHDLYRDVLLADLDPRVRRTLHAACVATLRRLGASPPLIARHTAQAEGSDVTAALRAALADLEHAPVYAAELLAEAAAQVSEHSADADDLAVERAGALAISGQVEAAEQVARQRLAHSRDPATHAALHALVLFCLISAAQVDAALDEIEAGTARAASAESRDTLAEVRRWVVVLGGRQRLTGPPPAGERSGGGLITDALELFLTGRPAQGYERAVRAAQVRAERSSRPWLDSPTAPVWPAFLALYTEGPGRARELSLHARRDAQRAGRLWLTPYHQSVSAGIHFMGGAWDDALAEVESGLEAAEATGTAWTSLPTATLLQILVRRGELDAAGAVARRWRARGLPEQFGLPQVAAAEVLLLEARDEVAKAADLARRSWTRALDRGRTIWPLIAGPDTLRVAQAAGDDDLIHRVARDTATVPVDQARAFAPAARLVGAVVERDAHEAAAAALDYRAAGHVPGEITAWEEASCLAAAGGASDEARTAAARCTALAASLGATTVERRLAARLRRLDVRLGARGGRRRPGAGWESLTPTELQIAELVGRGLTSPQVAARLYISPRTVQSHLSHILRKLDLRSRVELAASLARRAPRS